MSKFSSFKGRPCKTILCLPSLKQNDDAFLQFLLKYFFFCHYFPHIFPLSLFSVSHSLASFRALNMSVYIREVDFLRSLASISEQMSLLCNPRLSIHKSIICFVVDAVFIPSVDKILTQGLARNLS